MTLIILKFKVFKFEVQVSIFVKKFVNVWIYSNLGSFLNRYNFTQELNDPDYINDVGEATGASENATCRVTNGPLVAETQIGCNRLLSRVALDGREFGTWGFMIHHDRNGARCWTSPTRVTAADWEPSADGGGRLVVTAEARGSGIAYRVKEAFTFTPGQPVFRADVLEIANIGKEPIDMKRIYFSPFAAFAGEVESSAAKPVPNLYVN